MIVTPSAMKRILSDEKLKKLMMCGNFDEICSTGDFIVHGKVVSLKEEGGHGIGLVDFRTIKGDCEEIAERFSDCEREIRQYGNQFIRDLLESHHRMVESRSDLTEEQKSDYRKMIIGSWHNTKIVKHIEVA